MNANQLPPSPASEHREVGRRQLLVIDCQLVVRPSLPGWWFWSGFGNRCAGGFLRHPSSGRAGDDLGADSRCRRVDSRDGIAPDPIAMGYELVPAYIAADSAGQATLAATADTFASVALVTNAAGDFLGWGVLVAL